VSRSALRWLPPAVGLAGCVAARPLLLASALDVETLILNLYEQQAAPTWLVPWTTGLITWGPLPLLLLLGVGATAGLLRPLGVVPWAPTPRARAVLSAAVLIPFLAASIPLALAVATLVAVEALSWIEWLYDLNPTMEAIYVLVPALLLPGLWLGAFRGTARALGAPRRRPGAGLAPYVGRAVAGGAMALSLVAALTVGVAAAPQAARAARSHGSEAFKDNCGTCHFRTAALNFVKSPSEWRQTVQTMQAFDPTIEPREAEDALAFLTAVRSQSDSWVVRTRCGRCHGSSHAGWEHRTREDWEGLLHRIGRWSPVYYDVETRRRLLDWLAEHRGDEAASLGLPPARWEAFMEVQRQCATCHSMSWNADTYRDGDLALARATVARMSQKMVDPLDEGQIDRIAQDWKALLDDPDTFDRLFPHDRPEPEPTSTDRVEDRRPARGGNY
jgi:mono/diheme cytochrome c family protein